jgi:mobilization protein NikA
MGQQSIPRFIRVTVYVSQREWRQLKAKLATQGMTISEWIRHKINEFLDED